MCSTPSMCSYKGTEGRSAHRIDRGLVNKGLALAELRLHAAQVDVPYDSTGVKERLQIPSAAFGWRGGLTHRPGIERDQAQIQDLGRAKDSPLSYDCGCKVLGNHVAGAESRWCALPRPTRQDALGREEHGRGERRKGRHVDQDA